MLINLMTIEQIIYKTTLIRRQDANWRVFALVARLWLLARFSMPFNVSLL